jgi:hypothetical protein
MAAGLPSRHRSPKVPNVRMLPDDQYAIAEREPAYHVGQLNGDRQ